MDPRELTGPSKPVVKRLFALSGNGCAFPKCHEQIIRGSSVIGRICHIKGAKPIAARYDPKQTATERHAFDNLILLCPNHHAVIDADEESYTVERLTKMKSDHERRATPLDDAQAEAAAQILVLQSIISTNQSGGITAHTVNFNLAPAASPPTVNPKTKEAVDAMWRSMLALGKEFSDLWVAETCLMPNEIESFFKDGNWPAFQSVNDYRYEDVVMRKMQSADMMEIEALRIYVPDDLWNIFSVHRALYGRLGTLYTMSFKKRKYQDWRADNLFSTNAGLVFSEEEFTRLKQMPLQGIQLIFSSIENEFRRRAVPFL